MEIKDALGIGKVLPINKFLELLQNTFGRVSKSYFDRKDVDTKAYERVKLAESTAREMSIISSAIGDNHSLTGGIEYKNQNLTITSPKVISQEVRPYLLSEAPLEQRIEGRINYQEAKKQHNIESITAFTAEELKDEPEVADTPIDEDWTSRFFRIAEDISDEEMQKLWGKILAEEIKQPKSCSLRTLELLRNLSKEEANLFIKIANLAISGEDNYFVFKGLNNNFELEKYNVVYREIATLIEIGLIQPTNNSCINILQKTDDGQISFISGQIVISVNIKANTPQIQIPTFAFTKSGIDLLKLINSKPQFEYLTSFARMLKNHNVQVRYATILERIGNTFRHTLPLQDFP